MKLTAALLVTLAALLYTGGEDYQQEQDDADFYCEMVTAGHWGNYKGIDCDE